VLWQLEAPQRLVVGVVVVLLGVGGVVALSMAADRGSKALVDWVLVSLLQRRGEGGREG